jgi:NAD(P)-dependent dehydrogenase (short-subunit alcohol dehydrogenase family)
MDGSSPGGSLRPVALVTGATGGIGEATCRALAAQGATVVAAARNRVRTEALCAELRASGARAMALELDVLDGTKLQASIGAAIAEVGPITWLINNAGVADSCKLDAPDATARLRRMFEVNFFGALRCFEACLAGMREAGGGHVVQIASSAALRGYPYVAGYVSTKHALLGWTRSAALELVRERIGVSAVCPHYVDSPMTTASVDNIVERTGRTRADTYASLAQMNPGGRLVTTLEVARAVCDLLAGARSGVVLELDGTEPRILEDGVPFPPR